MIITEGRLMIANVNMHLKRNAKRANQIKLYSLFI